MLYLVKHDWRKSYFFSFKCDEFSFVYLTRPKSFLSSNTYHVKIGKKSVTLFNNKIHEIFTNLI